MDGPSGEVASYALHIPPIMIWKLWPDMKEDIDLDSTLEEENKSALAYGTVANQEGLQRTFISLGAPQEGFLTVTVGLDVECDRLRIYSKAAPQIVIPHDGNDTEMLCRVGVIAAHFPTSPEEKPQSPKRAKTPRKSRSGG